MGTLTLLHVLAIIGGGALLLALLYIVQIARRVRGELRFRLTRLAVALALYGLSVVVLHQRGYSVVEILAFSVLVGLTPMIFIKAPKRLRYIPAHTRRAVLARDRAKYPPGTPLEIDHIVPHSKYGDCSLENLRAVPKGYNRRKAARWPRPLELLGHVPRAERESPTQAAERGREDDRYPRRAGRLLRLVIGVLLLGLCWYGFRNHQSLRPDGTAVSPDPVTETAPRMATRGTERPSPATGGQDQSDAGPEPAPATASSEPTSAAQESTAETVSGGRSLQLQATSDQPDSLRHESATRMQIERAGGSAVRGTTMQVVGIVTHIGKDEISVKRARDRRTVKCRFDSKETLATVRPTPGVTVTVSGIFTGTGWTGNVHLVNCELTGAR
jgi:hypothetical protein